MRRALLLAGILLVVGAVPAEAQVGEAIHSYRVDITINRDGSINVRETIAYDFGANRKHGIFRHVPVRFRYDDRYDRVYRMTGIAVDGSEGTPDQTEVKDENNQKVIRIGDPDREITGRHSYVIRYRVDGALNHFAEHDELYWNAIGTEWTVPITVANVHVSAPDNILRVACFAGPERSSLPCAGINSGEGGGATFTNGRLEAGEGMTVVAALRPGVVSDTGPILDERWSLQRAFAVNGQTVGLAGLLGLLGLGGVVRLIRARGETVARRARRSATGPSSSGLPTGCGRPSWASSSTSGPTRWTSPPPSSTWPCRVTW